MLAEERRKAIFDYIRKHGKGEVTILSDIYSVTKETIRSDLAKLQERGLIIRCHGGALPASHRMRHNTWSNIGLNNNQSIQQLAMKNQDFLHQINSHTKPTKICVLGALCINIVAKVDHIPQPSELIISKGNELTVGGQGIHQALAATYAGASVHFIAKVGMDLLSQCAHNYLATSDICSFTLYQSSSALTGSSLIYQLNDRTTRTTAVHSGANMTITDEDLDGVLFDLSDSELLLIQTEINISAVLKAAKLARSIGTKVLLNLTQDLAKIEELIQYVDYITLNNLEAQQFSGITITTQEQAQQAALIISQKNSKAIIIMIQNADGVLAYNGKDYHYIPAFIYPQSARICTRNAFNGALAAALAKGEHYLDAIIYAGAFTCVLTNLGGETPIPSHEDVMHKIKQNTILVTPVS